MDKLNIEYKQIKELKPYKKNAKKHDKTQVEQIANSIKEFGFTQPVIVDENNIVVAGHGRILGAKKAGLKEVPTVCLNDLTEEQIKAYRLVDNKLNESEWDAVLLSEELKEFEEVNMDLFGFDLAEDMEDIFEEDGDVKFTEILNEENNYIVLKFDNRIDWINAMGVLGIERVKTYPTTKNGKQSKKWNDRIGVGRVIDGIEVLRRLEGNEV